MAAVNIEQPVVWYLTGVVNQEPGSRSQFRVAIKRQTSPADSPAAGFGSIALFRASGIIPRPRASRHPVAFHAPRPPRMLLARIFGKVKIHQSIVSGSTQCRAPFGAVYGFNGFAAAVLMTSPKYLTAPRAISVTSFDFTLRLRKISLIPPSPKNLSSERRAVCASRISTNCVGLVRQSEARHNPQENLMKL